MKQNSQMAIFFLIMFLGLSLIINVALILDPGIIKNGYDDLEKDYEKLEKKYDSAMSELKLAKSDSEHHEQKAKDLYYEKSQLQEKYDELLKLYNEETKVSADEPNSLDEYAKDIDFDSLARTPDEYTGKAICMSGKVIQLLEDTSGNMLRVVINNDYDNIIIVSYDPKISAVRILENDQITFYGIYQGIKKYESVYGKIMSLPCVNADSIEIK